MIAPATFADVGRITVRDHDRTIGFLNELEYVDGAIYANVWRTTRIARIDPETGNVTGWLDLSDLLEDERASGPVDVLNGIAWDGQRLLVTGKLWGNVYALELLD